MKIRQKLTLLLAIIFAAAGCISSGILLYQAGKTSIDKTVDMEVRKCELALAAFERGMELRISVGQSQSVKEELVTLIFQEYAGDGYALVNKDGVFLNLSEYHFIWNNEWEQRDYGQYMIQNLDGRSVLIIALPVEVLGIPYQFFYGTDISQVYDEIDEQAVRFVAVEVFMVMVVLFLISMATKLVFRPLEQLESAALAIKGGDYSRRVDVLRADEVGTVGQAFNNMADQVESHIHQLEDVSGRQKQLIGSMAHEIKTPMTAIIGYADTLLNVRLEEAQKQKCIEKIFFQSQRLNRLSAKMMELIGLYDNESIVKVDCYMKEIIVSAGSFIREKWRDRDFTLRYKADDTVIQGDPDLLESLVMNLVDNSVKAMDEPGIIQIEMKEGVLTVSDSGKGIEPEELEKIRDPFYMTDKSRSRNQGGAGLGLALCDRIVAAHQAQMKISSKLGKGTRVQVIFYEKK